jgi:hypothetical protein
MSNTVSCPACKRTLRVPDRLLGQRVKCPACQETFTATAETSGPAESPDFSSPSTGTQETPSGRPRKPAREEFEEEPVPRRRRRLQHEDDDDDYDRPRRRRGRAGVAVDKVKPPAIALMVTAIIGLVVAVLGLLMNLLGVGLGAAQGGQEGVANLMSGAVGIISGIVGMVLDVIVLLGSMKMMKLESYGLALTASILALIPCTSPCCLLGVPFGIWALVVMNDEEVKAAFR